MAVAVTVSPSSFTPLSGATQQFTALVTGDPTNAGVTWSLQSEAVPAGQTPLSRLQEDIGTIDQNGLYTAPSLTRTTPAHCLVVATANVDGTTQGTAELLLFQQVFLVWTDTRKRNEQWDVCSRCGNPYPMSLLTQQKGQLVCYKTCWDNLTIERRQREIQQVFSSTLTPLPEGSDRRVVDRGFFIIDLETG